MKIAIAGCVHGEIETVYNLIEYIEKKNNIYIDLVLCCGDFQANRNLGDVKCMVAPLKYQILCSFYKYYSGEKIAPKLTIFIGGNHEASNYLQELPYGGWVAPNIYYLGYAGVVKIAGIRIAGLSGIFKDSDFLKGRYEKPPYNSASIKSCYHVRNLEMFRLTQLTPPLQIMMTHDWPEGIAKYGNVEQLLRYKPNLREDIEENKLGNPAATELLKLLKPDYWFAAHLHAKYAALVKHDDIADGKVTKFLALDKCLPQKKFLQILDIPHDSKVEMELKYDLEWLTVLYLTNHLISIKNLNNYMPGPGSGERWEFTPTEEEMEFVLDKFNNDLVIPKNFAPTASAHDPNKNIDSIMTALINSQTLEFCSKLCVDDPIALLQNDVKFKKSFGERSLSHIEENSLISYSDYVADDSVTSSNTETVSKSITRTPLKLPSPKLAFDNIVTSTPVLKSSNEKNDDLNDDEPSDNQQSQLFQENDAAEKTPKIFKKRNIAIYGSADDNNDN